jgi:hypothetical protein
MIMTAKKLETPRMEWSEGRDGASVETGGVQRVIDLSLHFGGFLNSIFSVCFRFCLIG